MWSQSLQGQQTFNWFTQSQLQSVIRNGIVPEWFHGIRSRKAAEELLVPKPPGYFLIRVSESRIGYTLSYRVEDSCRHFMIDALESGQYIIVGQNRRHRYLQDLVDFHRRTPIMPFNQVLTAACGQPSTDLTNYAELLLPERHLRPDDSLLQSNSMQLNWQNKESQEDVNRPALPYRPQNLVNSAVLPPNNKPNKHYPDLKELSPATNQVCIRTVSAPDGLSEPPRSSNCQPAKSHDVKLSVVSNLKNLRKKLQKKSTSQHHLYAEITVEAQDNSEYEVISGEQSVDGTQFGCNQAEELPYEYLQPPPFAPGYDAQVHPYM
ncbi:hematopoietic SH2 domain-containing protein homolog isoform X1 [Solea solea]|uniref:hematopoietic SH2 domain-containing protein homolog isoform X1 n=1 Tax=Solea solea TaxID=90069 RepID=UPI00272A7794|nr:hematopoietic SH2 domain-containing protein homolog isoform X1 [Solea solea]